MNLLRFAGVEPRASQAEASTVDDMLRKLVDTATAAHDHLRTNLKTDPGFASIICKALGCEHAGCGAHATAANTLEHRSVQLPDVVKKLTEG